MNPREHHYRLNDILERIQKINFVESYLLAIQEVTEETRDENLEEMAFDSILYSLLVIGEAVKALDPAMKASYPHIDWHGIVGLRNFLVHQYFYTEVGMITNVIDAPLLQLKKVCEFETYQ